MLSSIRIDQFISDIKRAMLIDATKFFTDDCVVSLRWTMRAASGREIETIEDANGEDVSIILSGVVKR
jgi:hypothetical protein